jgi:MFS transporter, putative metabolite:H+ symporter
VYIGLVAGDFGSGFLSQVLHTRKKVLAGFILATGALVVLYFVAGRASLGAFYAVCVGLGISTGYWAVFVTVASEQFGTNIRATVTTTAPNFVRGAVVPVTFAFQHLRGPLGVTGAALSVGGVTLALALLALTGLEETYGKDLDYVD